SPLSCRGLSARSLDLGSGLLKFCRVPFEAIPLLLQWTDAELRQESGIGRRGVRVELVDSWGSAKRGRYVPWQLTRLRRCPLSMQRHEFFDDGISPIHLLRRQTSQPTGDERSLGIIAEPVAHVAALIDPHERCAVGGDKRRIFGCGHLVLLAVAGFIGGA